MTLPATLAEIMALGRDALHAVVRHYIPVFGLQPWEITARWVEPEDAESPGEVVAGFCEPNARYQRATIGVAWPPVGDIEETVVHELAHCFTAKLAYAAGAGTDAWALDEWEHIAEQSARGMVALRRHGERSPQILARVFRSKIAALRRNRTMDPSKLAELAMKAGELAAREDVPEDVRGFLQELVTAIASGGDATPEAPAAEEEDPDAAPPMVTEEDPEKAPAYMRKLAGQVKELVATVARLAPSAATRPSQPSADLTEMRSLAIQSFLSTKPGILSAEMERSLVDGGDMVLARSIVAEVERRPVQRRGATAPGGEDRTTIRLTPEQIKAARRHRLTDEQYAASVKRQTDRKIALGRGGN